MELTNIEELAIRKLEEVARILPKSLWLFSVSGTLYVMKKDKEEFKVDRQCIVGIINIKNGSGNFP